MAYCLRQAQVGSIPAAARQFGGAIDVVPVRRIVSREFVEAPGNIHLAEHSKVRTRIGVERVEKSAVPIEQHGFDGMFLL